MATESIIFLISTWGVVNRVTVSIEGQLCS